jgi:hypothetical protein
MPRLLWNPKLHSRVQKPLLFLTYFAIFYKKNSVALSQISSYFLPNIIMAFRVLETTSNFVPFYVIIYILNNNLEVLQTSDLKVAILTSDEGPCILVC